VTPIWRSLPRKRRIPSCGNSILQPGRFAAFAVHDLVESGEINGLASLPLKMPRCSWLPIFRRQSCTRTISLRLPQHLLDSIKTAANARDLPYQSLIKVWFQENRQES